MNYESIVVSPVTPRIGATVEGVTLAKPLSNCQVEELHQALVEHQVLFFRDQPIDENAHKRLGRYFGQSPRFWLNVQTECDLRNAKQLIERVTREVHPLAMVAE